MTANDGRGIEAGWDRREAFVDLTAPELAAMLAPVFGACTLAAVEPLSGGLVNSNHRVQVAGASQPVVVRVYTRDADACSRDAALFRLVEDRVPVPELLWADAAGERSYAVMSWVEGVSLTTALEDAPGEVGRAVGETLAAIGGHTFPRAGFFSADLTVTHAGDGVAVPFLEHIEHCLDTGAAARLGEPLATEVRAFVRRHARYLPAEPRPAALVHGDYKAGNILLHQTGGRWGVAAVLDWEFAFAGPPVFDLGILLRYARRLPVAFEQGVIAGFAAAGGALAPEWKRTIRLLDFVNLCDFLRTQGRSAALVDDVTGLITRTMRDWETYG